MPDKRAGMMEHSKRGGNGMCKVSFCLYSNRNGVGKKPREVSALVNEQRQPKEAFPLRQYTTNVIKTHSPLYLWQMLNNISFFSLLGE